MIKITRADFFYFLCGLFRKRNGVKCPYCGNAPIVYAKKYGVIDICRCPECYLYFVSPFYLSGYGLEKFYNEDYSSDATILPGRGALESIKRSNFRLSPKDCNPRLGIIRKLVVGNKLLEFGASWGYFMFQAKEYGFDSVGIEISEKRSEFGRQFLGVDIRPDIDLVKDRFDLIYSSHVLEHLTDLSEMFDKFYTKLLPGGTLIVEVPNFNPEIKGKEAYPLIGKVHPLGFSRQFFEKNLIKHGFVSVSVVGRYEDLLQKPEDRLPLSDVVIVRATKPVSV